MARNPKRSNDMTVKIASRDVEGRGDHGRDERQKARIAEDAGAVAVMALERIPATSAAGGVSRMSAVEMVEGSWPRSRSRSCEVPDRALRRGGDPRGARVTSSTRARSSRPRRGVPRLEARRACVRLRRDVARRGGRRVFEGRP